MQRLLDAGGSHADHDGAAVGRGQGFGTWTRLYVLLIRGHGADINAWRAWWGISWHAAAFFFFLVRVLIEHTSTGPGGVNAKGKVDIQTLHTYYGHRITECRALWELDTYGSIARCRELILTRVNGEWSGFCIGDSSVWRTSWHCRVLCSERELDVNLDVGRFGSALRAAAASGDFTILCEVLDHGTNSKAGLVGIMYGS